MSTTRQRDRAALLAHLRFSAAAAATTWIAMWSWRGFTTMSARFIVALVLVGVAVAVTGAVARWRRLPTVVVVLAQLVVGGAMTCQVVASRPWPGGAFLTRLSDAVDAANTYASPVPTSDTVSVQPLLILGGFVAMLLVDLCACSLRRVPLAGLPLLTVYSVPISLIDRGLSWWVFAATAAGFLFLLFLQEEEHLSRWGRSLDGSTAPVRRLSDSVRGSALAVGSLAVAAAIVVPLAVPTLSFSVFDVGPGNGGDGDIEVTNPMVDLREDLIRGDRTDLLTVRTADPAPDHLRISVLNRYTDNQWTAGDRKVPTSNLAQGSVPELVGVNRGLVDFREYGYEVEVTEAFESRWLPTQAPITSVVADGDWRFDEATMDFLASDDELTTAGLSYEMTAVLPTYADDRLLQLNTAPTTAPEEFTELPDDLPLAIDGYTRRATAGGTTDFEKAVLLNQFFRETGGFKYALPSDPGGGVGTGELVDFLDPEAEGGRIGYCEQYAAAMGVMARQLGIPARVAVGFLAPSRVPGSPDTWVYTSDDLHAWTELYFPGAGWVLFDPTPDDRTAGSQPSYTEQVVEQPVIPTDGPSSRETREAPTQSAGPRAELPTEVPDPTTAADDASGDGSSFPWLVVLAVLVGLLLLALALFLPQTLRRRQRERRLAGGPEAAWDELRASAADLGLTWPEGRSPRETRDVVAGWFGKPGGTDQRPARGEELAPESVAALERIVLVIERLRYSRRHATAPGSLHDDALLVVRGLTDGTGPRTRRRAHWFPVSVLQRDRFAGTDEPTTPAEPELVGSRSETL
ncbi:MAG: t [Nocardioides sp.]|nr:t [Nocardioides sp.]